MLSRPTPSAHVGAGSTGGHPASVELDDSWFEWSTPPAETPSRPLGCAVAASPQPILIGDDLADAWFR